MSKLFCCYIEGVDPPGWCRTHMRQIVECENIGKIGAIHEAIERIELTLKRDEIDALRAVVSALESYMKDRGETCWITVCERMEEYRKWRRENG